MSDILKKGSLSRLSFERLILHRVQSGSSSKNASKVVLHFVR